MSYQIAQRKVTLFTKATTGTSEPVPQVNMGLITVYVIGYGTISAGTLILEEMTLPPSVSSPGSYDGGYGGTWSVVETIDLTDATGGSTTGNQLAVHIPTSAPGAYAFDLIRARFSVDISGSGGSASIVLVQR